MLTSSPNDLESFWMPYTANRQFKAQPRLFVSAKDMQYQRLSKQPLLIIRLADRGPGFG
jgi:beta-alanine--pyruvate transaminase